MSPAGVDTVFDDTFHNRYREPTEFTAEMESPLATPACWERGLFIRRVLH